VPEHREAVGTRLRALADLVQWVGVKFGVLHTALRSASRPR
jgi:hypothetical protein